MLGTPRAGLTTAPYGQKPLDKTGITVEALDLSGAFGRSDWLQDDVA